MEAIRGDEGWPGALYMHKKGDHLGTVSSMHMER
jgi:hypothetical protein